MRSTRSIRPGEGSSRETAFYSQTYVAPLLFALSPLSRAVAACKGRNLWPWTAVLETVARRLVARTEVRGASHLPRLTLVRSNVVNDVCVSGPQPPEGPAANLGKEDAEVAALAESLVWLKRRWGLATALVAVLSAVIGALITGAVWYVKLEHRLESMDKRLEAALQLQPRVDHVERVLIKHGQMEARLKTMSEGAMAAKLTCTSSDTAETCAIKSVVADLEDQGRNQLPGAEPTRTSRDARAAAARVRPHRPEPAAATPETAAPARPPPANAVEDF